MIIRKNDHKHITLIMQLQNLFEFSFAISGSLGLQFQELLMEDRACNDLSIVVNSKDLKKLSKITILTYSEIGYNIIDLNKDNSNAIFNAQINMDLFKVIVDDNVITTNINIGKIDVLCEISSSIIDRKLKLFNNGDASKLEDLKYYESVTGIKLDIDEKMVKSINDYDSESKYLRSPMDMIHAGDYHTYGQKLERKILFGNPYSASSVPAPTEARGRRRVNNLSLGAPFSNSIESYNETLTDSAINDIIDNDGSMPVIDPFKEDEIVDEKPISKAAAYIKKQKNKVPFFNNMIKKDRI